MARTDSRIIIPMRKTRQTDRLTRARRRLLLFLLAALPIYCFLSSCSQIDCPLNNRVYVVFRFMNSVGDSVKVSEVINVSTDRHEKEDSVVLNQFTGRATFSIPMSYTQDEDVYYFEITGSNYHYIDTVRIKKESRPHFESVDCNPSFFHTITGVNTTHHTIDSVTIINKNVTYDSYQANLHIHLRSSN